MKAISFLGTGKYQKVTYWWMDREWQTNLFPEAVVRIFEPEKLFLLVTPAVRKQEHFKELCDRLGKLMQPVDIPEGKSEEELWKLFDEVGQIVSNGDEILLDITHAFRSLPLILFVVAAYLRRTKNVNIRHIVYGVYEAREPFRPQPEPTDRAPIFDLTPLLDLLDWLNGAEFLLRRSDATLLAERLHQIRVEAWRRRAGGELPQKLQALSGTLSSYSKAFQLARPLDVMNYARKLVQLLNVVKSEVELWAKPFGVILEQVNTEAEKFDLDEPKMLNDRNLSKQFSLIEHCLEKGMTMQAIILAREWLVSYVALKRGIVKWLERQVREEEIEKELNHAAEMIRFKQRDAATSFKPPLNEKIAEIWNWLTDLRNDLAHCGMRDQPAKISNLEKRAKEIPGKLKLLS